MTSVLKNMDTSQGPICRISLFIHDYNARRLQSLKNDLKNDTRAYRLNTQRTDGPVVF